MSVIAQMRAVPLPPLRPPGVESPPCVPGGRSHVRSHIGAALSAVMMAGVLFGLFYVVG